MEREKRRRPLWNHPGTEHVGERDGDGEGSVGMLWRACDECRPWRMREEGERGLEKSRWQ